MQAVMLATAHTTPAHFRYIQGLIPFFNEAFTTNL
jgi:hypothetical protein